MRGFLARFKQWLDRCDLGMKADVTPNIELIGISFQIGVNLRVKIGLGKHNGWRVIRNWSSGRLLSTTPGPCPKRSKGFHLIVMMM